MSVKIFAKRIVALSAIFLTSIPCFATKCMEPGTIEDLKKVHPVLVLGRVEERKPLDSRGSVELKIAVTKFLNGKETFDHLTATEVRGPSSPMVVKKVYELNKEYVFPVKPSKGKNPPVVYVQPDGCPDLVIKDQSK